VPEFILADERVRQLAFQRQALLIRQARIEALLGGKKTFVLPSPPSPDEGVDITQIVAQEKQTFETQTMMLQNQLDLLRSQKPRIQTLIASYAAQMGSVKKELDLITHNAEEYTRMVKQGLGISNVEMQLKLNQANQENELWRLTAETSRLQMDMGELDLKVQQAQATFNQQLVTELREVREKLRDIEVTLPSARELRLVKLQQAGGVAGGEAARTMTITRTRNGEAAVLQATETTPVEPGDMIEVRKLPPPAMTSSRALSVRSMLPDYRSSVKVEDGVAAAK
jgi:polysaccharide export outer membrane protein